MQILNLDEIERLAKLLQAGAVIGLPTETVWGLAVGLWSKTGVEKLMQIKNREVGTGKIFTLVPENVKNIPKYGILTPSATAAIRSELSSVNQANRGNLRNFQAATKGNLKNVKKVQNRKKSRLKVTGVTEVIRGGIPGPLTLILPKNRDFSHFYYDYFQTVGVRIPDFPLFSALLPVAGPLILTSANRRGSAPVKTAEELQAAIPEVDFVVQGQAGGQPPSQVVDFSGDTVRVLRR